MRTVWFVVILEDSIFPIEPFYRIATRAVAPLCLCARQNGCAVFAIVANKPTHAAITQKAIAGRCDMF